MYKSKSECLVGTSRRYGGANSNTAKKSALTNLEAEVLPATGCLSPLNQVFIQVVVGSKEHFASFSTVSGNHVKYHLLFSKSSS